MKHIIIIAILSLLSSCLVKRRSDRQDQSQQYSAYDRQQQYISWQITDSNNRFYHFQTDTAFFFHPEWGLGASRGAVSLVEGSVQTQSWISRRDSTTAHDYQEKSKSRQSKTTSSWRWWYWLLLTIPLIGFLGWKLRRLR